LFCQQQNIYNCQQSTMSDVRTRKAKTLSWATELKLGTKLEMTDDKRIERIMEYLQDKAPRSCFDQNNCKEQTCHCLSKVKDGNYRNAVALHILWFSALKRKTQQLLIMEKIRARQLVPKNKRYGTASLYYLPYKTELMEVTEALGNVTICKYALMALLRFGKVSWDMCKVAVDNGIIPEHGLKGKSMLKSKKSS
jgi:hypothetical protein